MKLILIISLLFSCSTMNEVQEEYLKLFKDLNLPLIVNRANIFEYNSMIFDKNTETHKRNIYPILKSEFYKNIIQKDYEKIDYRCIYKFKVSNEVWATILTEDFVDEDDVNEMWFMLYTYNKNGEIIENLRLGGYKIDYKEQFYSIDKEMNISTELFEFLPPPDNDYDNMYAKKSTKKYKLQTTGKIVKQEELEEKGKFTITEDGYKEIN